MVIEWHYLIISTLHKMLEPCQKLDLLGTRTEGEAIRKVANNGLRNNGLKNQDSINCKQICKREILAWLAFEHHALQPCYNPGKTGTPMNRDGA